MPMLQASSWREVCWVLELLDRWMDLPPSTISGSVHAVWGQCLETLYKYGFAVSGLPANVNIMGVPVPNSSKDLAIQRRARRRSKFVRWRLAFGLRRVLVKSLEALVRGSNNVVDIGGVGGLTPAERERERERLESVRQHLRYCLVECGRRQVKCEESRVCSGHLQHSFSQSTGHDQLNILDRDREGHSLMEQEVLSNSQMLSVLMDMDKNVGSTDGHSMERSFDGYGSPNGTRASGMSYAGKDCSHGVEAEWNVLAWQLYHEVDMLQEELLRAGRHKAEELMAWGRWNSLLRCVRAPVTPFLSWHLHARACMHAWVCVM
jgi:hypothetical protein